MKTQNNPNSISPEMWEEETNREPVSIEDMNEALVTFHESRVDYDAKKKISNEADAECKLRKKKLYELLQRAGKSKWQVEGVGSVTATETFSYPTPKDPEAKKALAKYIEDVHGKEAFWNLFSINSMTLQGWTKQELENDPGVKIPGLEDPIAREKITFRKER